MKRTMILALSVVTILFPVVASAGDGDHMSTAGAYTPPELPSISQLEWNVGAKSTSLLESLENPRLHRILGYTTIAGVIATGLLGWLAPGDLHGAVAIATTGTAVANTTVGILTYAGTGSVPLPHLLLTAAGTIGFVTNLFLAEEDDSGGVHRWLGTASASAFALGLVWVIPF
jgi:hypothetical protein